LTFDITDPGFADLIKKETEATSANTTTQDALAAANSNVESKIQNIIYALEYTLYRYKVVQRKAQVIATGLALLNENDYTITMEKYNLTVKQLFNAIDNFNNSINRRVILSSPSTGSPSNNTAIQQAVEALAALKRFKEQIISLIGNNPDPAYAAALMI